MLCYVPCVKCRFPGCNNCYVSVHSLCICILVCAPRVKNSFFSMQVSAGLSAGLCGFADICVQNARQYDTITASTLQPSYVWHAVGSCVWVMCGTLVLPHCMRVSLRGLCTLKSLMCRSVGRILRFHSVRGGARTLALVLVGHSTISEY